MAESLFLNKTKVDIYSKPITRRIQIGKVSEVSERKSSYSYTIQLPKTSRNKQVLEMLGVQGNTSRKPYEEIVCDYIIDNVSIVQNGFAIIRETSKYYNLNIIDGVRSLSELLKDKKLSDLPLEDLNHILTTQNYIDSYENIEGFIYGIADYGRGVSVNLKVEEQAPSIYVHTIFRRIFESNGLSLQGEFFDTNEKYLTEVLTPSRGYEITDSSYTSTAKGGADTNVLSGYQTSNEFIQFDRKFTFSDVGLVGASIVSGDIVFSVAGTYRIDIDCTYSSYITFLNVKFKINDTTKAYIYLEEGNSQTKSKSITFSVEAGDVIQLWVNGGSSFEEQDEFGQYQVNYSLSCDSLLFLQTGGQLIVPSDYIGEMNQLDFLKDIINRFGLVLHPLQNTSEFKFKRLEAILSDRATAEDWTSKLAAFESEKYISGYARTNKANYKYPEAIVIPNNDGEMLIDNENAKSEKTMFSSPFEIPVEASSLSGNETYLIPVWGEEEGAAVNKETPLKIMNINRIDISINAKLFEEVTGITQTENIPFLNLDFISMEYFLSNYYKAFQNLIENYKEVSLKINLNVVDIFNLDFFRLKYLRQTGRFYYLNAVKNTTGRISSVEAIEIKEFPENEPPSQVGTFSFNMNHSSVRTITLNNLKTGYEDPELDEPLKIKIISGFNSDVLLKQDGVTITSETEINVEDLALTAVEVLGGVSAYSESWVFAIADAGSGTYGTQTGLIEANVLIYVNNPPVANAGADQIVQVPVTEEFSEPVFVTLNGSASYDLTGEIVSYLWEVVSKPASSTMTLTQNTINPLAYVEADNDFVNIGTYEFQLTVTDEFGSSDTDTMEVEIIIIT